jgi:hypothetical protein
MNRSYTMTLILVGFKLMLNQILNRINLNLHCKIYGL